MPTWLDRCFWCPHLAVRHQGLDRACSVRECDCNGFEPEEEDDDGE